MIIIWRTFLLSLTLIATMMLVYEYERVQYNSYMAGYKAGIEATKRPAWGI